MANRLKGKVAIVTGAGRGIGRAEALALAAEGAKVVVNDLGGTTEGTGASHTPAEEVVQEIKKLGGEAAPNYDNVATPDGGENIIKTAIDKFGRLDILVNNAGILRNGHICDMSEDDWDAVMKVHLYGHFHCTRPACVIFRQQRSGRIINTSSSAGLGTDIGQANYSAAKEGIIGFTRTVARDMGKYGVTCNALRPWAATRLTLSVEVKALWEQTGKQDLIDMIQSGTPEMIGPLLVFLCTDAAANVNGYDFIVGGGQIGVYTQPEIAANIVELGKVWTVDELVDVMPEKVTGKLINPAPRLDE